MVSSSRRAFVALIFALYRSLVVTSSVASLLSGSTVVDDVPQSKESTSAMLSLIEKGMGVKARHAIERRVLELESALHPTYIALPRNVYGNLAPDATTYALHRYFVAEKGWFVKGLHEVRPHSDSFALTSPVEILQDQVPVDVKQGFQARLSGYGFGLKELAILAAALEDLVHRETMERVAAALKAQVPPLVGEMQAGGVQAVLEHVMMSYILDGSSIAPNDQASYQQGLLRIEDVYPGWAATKEFLRDVQNMVAPTTHGNHSFEDLARMVEEVNEHYGRYQDDECQTLKHDLLKLEGKCPGRVDLRRFYGSALHDGMWQFSESVSYLRSLDVLDESYKGHPSLITASYVLGPSNCITSSKYYAQCCLDSCGGFMAKLEMALAAPEAPVAAVEAAVAAALPDPEASLEVLHLRLEEIAEANGGSVPLHGRLFAQWLHHAYPRECPAPTVGLTKPPELPEAFEARTGKASRVTNEYMQNYYNFTEADDREQCELPWTLVEEPPMSGLLPNRDCVVALAAVAVLAVASFAIVLRRSARRVSAPGPLLATVAMMA